MCKIGHRQYAASFFKSIGGRYKRIRLRPEGKPDPEYYRQHVSVIAQLEELNRTGETELYCGDESHVCSQGYVPYGRQFPGEDIHIPVGNAYRINCMGFINRKSQYKGFMTEKNIGAELVMQYLDDFSFKVRKEAVLILDNASIHKAKIIKKKNLFWQNRELFISFPPPYSPHLNIAETLRRKLKKEWLNPDDLIIRTKTNAIMRLTDV